MITRRSLFFAFGTTMLGGAAAFASDDPPTETPKYFETLFPTPTGTNGFEELVRASESAQKTQAKYSDPNRMTLSEKRAFLADPGNADALLLLQQGLAKPMHLPDFDPLSTPFPWGALRSLSRLLDVQIYVRFAEGKNDAALQSLARNFKMSSTISGISILGMLVANAMNMIGMRYYLRFREVWNIHDCQHILDLTIQQMMAPDPILAAIENERKINLLLLDKWRHDTDEMSKSLTDAYPSNDDEPESLQQKQAREYAQAVQLNGAVRTRVLREFADMIQEQYNHALALVQDPTRPMAHNPPSGDAKPDPITAFLGNTIFLDFPTIQRGIENQLTIQLFGVHAAIRRYRWEYGKLPGKISSLAVGRQYLRDPFTGGEIIYTPAENGIDYRIGSAGALQPGENGKSTREPFYFPRESAPAAPS